MKVCNVSGCGTLHDSKGGRCPTHARDADKGRGTARDRGYNTRGHQAFRDAVLTRDMVCVIPDCMQWATVADHYPHSRRELVDMHMNPNDPRFGRGLCLIHHSIETAQHQPGGFNT